MRVEDEIIGAELEEAHDQDQIEVLEREEEVEESDEEVAVTAAHDSESAHYLEIAAIVRSLLEGDEVSLGDLEVSDDQLVALRALAAAAHGHTEGSAQLIYAEDRLQLLNDALAALGPTLAMTLDPMLDGTRDLYDELVAEVSELRDRLLSLEDAQEEVFHHDEVKAGGDEADDDDAEAEDGAEVDDEVEPPSTLAGKPGEPAVERPVTPSTLAGKPGEPAVELVESPSTLAGKPGEPAVELAESPSTLIGTPGEPAIERPVVPSTLGADG